MKKALAVVAAISFFFTAAPPTYALPDYSYSRTYYDDNGNEVGYESVWCNGHYSMTGTQTDNWREFDTSCETIQPISCGDVGLYTDNSGGCVTQGYCLWEHTNGGGCTYPQ